MAWPGAEIPVTQPPGLAGSSHPQIVETRAIAEGKAIAYENVLAALRGCWTELEIDS